MRARKLDSAIFVEEKRHVWADSKNRWYSRFLLFANVAIVTTIMVGLVISIALQG